MSQDNKDFWAEWAEQPTLKDRAFDWLLDRALGFFYWMDGLAIWWKRKGKYEKD